MYFGLAAALAAWYNIKYIANFLSIHRKQKSIIF